jgi:16S rRNA (adenine1518-N6/adenine1519-N6)-dimethyltransferase
VLSAVVRFTSRPDAPTADGTQEALLLASLAFQHRRKKIANALESRYSRVATMSALGSAGISPDLRAQHLTLEQWLDLAGGLRDTTVER